MFLASSIGRTHIIYYSRQPDLHQMHTERGQYVVYVSRKNAQATSPSELLTIGECFKTLPFFLNWHTSRATKSPKRETDGIVPSSIFLRNFSKWLHWFCISHGARFLFGFPYWRPSIPWVRHWSSVTGDRCRFKCKTDSGRWRSCSQKQFESKVEYAHGYSRSFVKHSELKCRNISTRPQIVIKKNKEQQSLAVFYCCGIVGGNYLRGPHNKSTFRIYVFCNIRSCNRQSVTHDNLYWAVESHEIYF